MRRSALAALLAAFLAALPAQAQAPVRADLDKALAAKPARYWKALVERDVRTALRDQVFVLQGRPANVPPVADEPVQRVWLRILDATGIPGQPVVFVDDCSWPSVDSFPVGAVRVCKAFLARATTEDELAAALSHEAAHMLLDHFAYDARNRDRRDMWKTASALGILLGAVASGGTLPAAGIIYGGAHAQQEVTDGGDANRAHARRDEELAADRLGLELMVRAGFSASGYLQLIGRDAPCVDEARAMADLRAKGTRGRSAGPTATHPDDNIRGCLLRANVLRNYAEALGRPQTVLPWGRPEPNGLIYFSDMQEADFTQAQFMGGPPTRERCVQATRFMANFMGRNPEDRDYAMLAAAIHMRCGDDRGAYGRISAWMKHNGSTHSGYITLMAIATHYGDSREAERMFRSAYNLQRKLAPGDDLLEEYELLACQMRSPALDAAYVRLCEQVERPEFRGTCKKGVFEEIDPPYCFYDGKRVPRPGPVRFLQSVSPRFAILPS